MLSMHTALTNLWKLGVQSCNPRGLLDQCASASRETQPPFRGFGGGASVASFAAESAIRLSPYSAHSGPSHAQLFVY